MSEIGTAAKVTNLGGRSLRCSSPSEIRMTRLLTYHCDPI
jgi:hypothetical protein